MINYNKSLALPNEVWEDVRGYKGLYKVSSMGRVRSLDRWVAGKGDSMRLIRGRILKPVKDKDGYLYIDLYKDGKRKTHKVHRLVAEAFLNPVAGKDFVNHLDEVKTSNHYSNLEYCTPKENNSWGTRNERVAKTLTNGKQSKPVVGVSPKTGKVVVEFPSIAEAGRNGFDYRNISACCRGKLKHHHGFIWRYK